MTPNDPTTATRDTSIRDGVSTVRHRVSHAGALAMLEQAGQVNADLSASR
jgi:hypothetical protein